ncbi:unnamed protein product [Moneuplotes crassus]|uniref:Uncharacterized protein n=1 Tax=Euplotes crassus TaxID=5936 RepID=A0AAD1XQW3_EUPCR|nr:unnamed protein product [Moneuplotes crassus]
MSFESEVEQKDKLISILEAENTTLKLSLEEKEEKINELEKWMSILKENQACSDNENIISSVNKSMATIEKLRLEKFYLKKMLTTEKKRYNDLKSAFIELRQAAKDKEIEYKDLSKQQLVEDKLSLQNTIMNLSTEIESLSVKNEEFLSILTTKDFYKEYQESQEELKNLREAHTILINLIKDQEITVQNMINIKELNFEESNDLLKDTSTILGYDVSHMNRTLTSQRSPLSEIDMNKGRESSISSLFSCNAIGTLLHGQKMREVEMNMKNE